jgi:hypothetical protein
LPIPEEGAGPLFERINGIKRMGLISVKPNLRETKAREKLDFQDVFNINESGMEYLTLLDKLPTDSLKQPSHTSPARSDARVGFRAVK